MKTENMNKNKVNYNTVCDLCGKLHPACPFCGSRHTSIIFLNEEYNSACYSCRKSFNSPDW